MLSPAAQYDLLIAGGTVVDPSQGLSALRDLAISGHHIARLAANIPRGHARKIVDATGMLVTPGLIDLHVHVYDGVMPISIPADPNCVAKGVTTVVDAGSAGAHTFPAFLKHVVNSVDTRVFALLNLSVIGQASFSRDVPYGELLDLRYASPRAAIRVIEAHRGVIKGIKVRLSRMVAGEDDLTALDIAKEAAVGAGVPLMVHVGGTHSPLSKIIARLEKGDIVTHAFHGQEGGILDETGQVLADVRAATHRGVLLDVGHGARGFSFAVAERALQQDIVPWTISTDLHSGNVAGPVFDLVTTLSKFLLLGLSLEEVVACATGNPAKAVGLPKDLGTLKEGAEADVSVFSLAEGDFEFADSAGATRIGHRKLILTATIKAGRVYVS